MRPCFNEECLVEDGLRRDFLSKLLEAALRGGGTPRFGTSHPVASQFGFTSRTRSSLITRASRTLSIRGAVIESPENVWNSQGSQDIEVAYLSGRAK